MAGKKSATHLARRRANRPDLFSSAAKAPKQFPDFRSDSIQLPLVDGGKFLQNLFAATIESNQNPAAVFLRWHTNDQFFRGKPVYQANRAVMPKLQSFRQLSHSDLVARGKTLDGQQRLILLRRDTLGMRRFVAKMDKPPERITECGQRFILRLNELPRSRHRPPV
jgi:hypothetical protein